MMVHIMNSKELNLCFQERAFRYNKLTQEVLHTVVD